jgi:uncharacterized membrane protein
MTQERFERVISLVLLSGVICSTVLILVGLVTALLFGWGGASADASTLDPTDFSDLLPRLQEAQPLAITQLGLIVLMLTPVVRVAVSALGFALERDRVYLLITLAVLAILLLSLTLFR